MIEKINGSELEDSSFQEYINTVGAVLFSFSSSFSPASVFGGSWSKVSNRFLYGTSSGIGATGGSQSVTLSVDQMPHHVHGSHYLVEGGWPDVQSIAARTITWASQSQCHIHWDAESGNLGLASFDGDGTSGTGSGQSHENMPPYITCYIWRRIS